MHYYLINVLGKNGYSFMVATKENNDERVNNGDYDDIISKAYDKGLFADADDAECCTITVADETEQKFFGEYTAIDC